MKKHFYYILVFILGVSVTGLGVSSYNHFKGLNNLNNKEINDINVKDTTQIKKEISNTNKPTKYIKNDPTAIPTTHSSNYYNKFNKLNNNFNSQLVNNHTISMQMYDFNNNKKGILTAKYPDNVVAKKVVIPPTNCKNEPGCIKSYQYRLQFEYNGSKMQVGTFFALDAFGINKTELNHYEKINNNIYYIEYSWLKNKSILEKGHATYAKLLINTNACPSSEQACFIVQGQNFVFMHTNDNLDIKVDVAYKLNITDKEKQHAKAIFSSIVKTIQYKQ